MSWKSLLSAGLLCILATPAFAVPNLSITNGGLDATTGEWIWNVTVTPSAAGTPMAVELGLRETTAGAQLVSAVKTTANFDTDNPGTQIFTWETLTDVDPGAGVNNRPVGLQTNTTLDEIFAALGSIDFADATAKQVLTVKTAGPVDTRLSTSLQVLGKYGTGGTNGRVAEITGSTATNYSNFGGAPGLASRTIVVGDVNLSGIAGGGAAVTIADFSTLVGNLNKAGSFHWGQGDLNGSTSGTEVTIADFSLLVGCLNKTTPACSTSANTPVNINGVAGGAGSGSLAVAGVPEPASMALAGLALLGMFGLTGRRRR